MFSASKLAHSIFKLSTSLITITEHIFWKETIKVKLLGYLTNHA